MKSEVLSVKEKIGYGMGDAASHIIFDNVMLYMMFFYTDIFGIPAGFVGTMFLVARALDAISDPCMGLLADRTRSRWGKFRPWVPLSAGCWLMADMMRQKKRRTAPQLASLSRYSRLFRRSVTC